ncbi:hypothetical protein K490DRAFT_62913 [Saccharata proteae CBS 121410]|uniref:Uncharacterized protein n=1 Tax=Saccharata proteae CBS 121410 TaxID=1314787 RepID=A0A9P4LYM0_9PEZI|nr:hypothetical protein K490DRAFT_62913 [Saccharata proteae CBS 121410]
MHAVLEPHQKRRGPLDDKAKLIYGEMIAGSDAEAGLQRDEAQEAIYMLPYTPDVIRFWVDERSPDHPDVESNKVREGTKDDCPHCSCMEVRLKKQDELAGEPRYCDVYVGPSITPTWVWIYRDPKKPVPSKSLRSIRDSVDALMARSKGKMPKHVEVEKDTADDDDLWAGIADEIETEPVSKPLPPLPVKPKKKVRVFAPKPEGFETDLFKDLDRVASHGALLTMHEQTHEDDDYDEELEDDFDSLHPGYDHKLQSMQQRYRSLGVTGPRAMQSGFFDALSTEGHTSAIHQRTDIVVVGVMNAELRGSFARPSLINRIVARIIMGLSRSETRKKRGGHQRYR